MQLGDYIHDASCVTSYTSYILGHMGEPVFSARVTRCPNYTYSLDVEYVTTIITSITCRPVTA
jgi:hypothetical protein